MADGIERELGGINAKLKNIEAVLTEVAQGQKDLPCKQQDDSNPIVQIAKVKSSLGILKWLSGFLLTGVVGLVVVIFRKLFNGG